MMILNFYAVLYASMIAFINFFPGFVCDGPRFYRSGWPEERFKFAPGSTAMLRCDHIGYAGDAKKAPPAFMTWFKDGKLIKSLPGKIKIFGGKRRPLIEGTKLSLMSLDPEDAGVYTCKLALKDTIPNPKYILSMSVQVTVLPSPDNRKFNSSCHQTEQSWTTVQGNASTSLYSILPSKNQSSSSTEENFVKMIIVGVFLSSLLLLLILVLSCKHWKKSLSKASRRNSESGIVMFSPEKQSVKDRNVTQIFPSSNRFDLMPEMEDCQPDYVNLGRYKDYFPFIKDEEWTLLKKSQISRQRIKCHLEHAMPIVLGTGNFGQVYQGEVTYMDGTTKSVAVKRLNDGCEIKEVGHFLKEALSLLKTGHHQNVISLVGSVLLDTLSDLSMQQETKKPPILLMEVAEEGNLKSFLQTRRLSDNQILKSSQNLEEVFHTKKMMEDFVVGRDLTLRDLASFLYQAARGMQHLASKKIVHRDLAARNVLLTSQRVIKIADFGLSKHIREMQQEYYRIHTPSVTPAKWTAPEALNENIFSVYSDVWSFGVLAWEIYTLGGAPYLNIPVTQLYRHLATGNRLEKPSFASHSTYRVMKQCWSWKPGTRPDFDDLVRLTDDNLTSLSKTYVELSSHDYTPNPSDISSDSFTSVTNSVIEIHQESFPKSPDSGRSSESVFTFSSPDDTLSHDRFDSFSESDIDRKMSLMSDLINPVYGFP